MTFLSWRGEARQISREKHKGQENKLLYSAETWRAIVRSSAVRELHPNACHTSSSSLPITWAGRMKITNVLGCFWTAIRDREAAMAECDVCHEEASKYKCPACGCRSCSSKCIQLHKDATPCSGQRNKAAYIPPNDYGYGALMDDYAYLEALSRNLEQVQKGPAHGKRPRKIELDWVKKARERHVTIILLQEGMERRKTNQTKWQDK